MVSFLLQNDSDLSWLLSFGTASPYRIPLAFGIASGSAYVLLQPLFDAATLTIARVAQLPEGSKIGLPLAFKSQLSSE